jgi:hypothetical protein
MAALIFTLIWFPAVGVAASRFAGRSSAFLLGAGMTGLWMYVSGVVGIPLEFAAIALAVATMLSLRPMRWQWPRLHIADALTLVAALALFAQAAIVPLEDFDGRAFWLLKAKAIAHESDIDGPLFQGENAVSPRNEYPLLVPIDAALLMRVGGSLDERHTRWLYVMFAVALALEMRRRFRAWFSAAIGAWSAALLLWLPQVAIKIEGGATSAYCDLPLAAFAALALFELVDGTPLRFGFWLAFVALTKNEGLPFAIFLLVLGAYVFRKRIAIAFVPLAIALATLFVWRSRIAPSDEENLFGLLLGLPSRLHRFPEAVSGVVRHMFNVHDWGVFWFAVVAACIALALRRDWRPLLLGAGAIVPMLTLYVMIYMVTNWVASELADASAPRLISHFVGAGAYLIAASVRSR